MSYLQPPPDMSPVVVVKDYGGYVNEYAAQTEIYRRTNREVRIHECHSACTMALGLPNVCVYPDSVFKFHQAYDPRNHVTNWDVSDQLFNTYPVAVRDRLGTLTKSFTILRGSELIDLGVRSCAEPQPRIMLANARPVTDSAMSGGSTLSALTGRLQGMIPNFGTPPQLQPASGPHPSPRPAPPLPDGMLGTKIPLPPEKPAELARAEPDATEPDTTEPDATRQNSAGQNAGGEDMPSADVPLPPPRPKILVAAAPPGLPPIPLVRIIAGAQSILPPHFVPFPKRV